LLVAIFNTASHTSHKLMLFKLHESSSELVSSKLKTKDLNTRTNIDLPCDSC